MNKNYNSGRKFEYRVKKHLEKKGYYVMRSAGSKSPFDLIAIPNNKPLLTYKVLLIQCKHGVKIRKKQFEVIAKLDKTFPVNVYCILAWSKVHGKIEFKNAYQQEIGWL